MERPLQIAFKDIDSSEALEELIRERVARLERFNRNIVGCRVVVEAAHRSPEGGRLALGVAVEIDLPGRKTVVTRAAEDGRTLNADHSIVVNRAFEAMQKRLEEDNEIRHGEVKAHPSDGETGVVVRLFPQQDYGFIEVKGSPDLYFTRNVVAGDAFDELTPGTIVQVTRATGDGPMGPQASSVRRLGGPSAPR